MSDITYQKFVRRWEEVTDLPPQTVGPLTPLYRRLTRRLKVMPWPLVVTVSTATIVGLYVILGTAITFLVSILQRGF